MKPQNNLVKKHMHLTSRATVEVCRKTRAKKGYTKHRNKLYDGA